MQLIEIIQLVLVGFIVVSAIIFLISYILYRSKSSLAVTDHKSNTAKPNPPSQPNENRNFQQEKFIPKSDIDQKTVAADRVPGKKSKKKFEVFIPSKDETRISNPKLDNSTKSINNNI